MEEWSTWRLLIYALNFGLNVSRFWVLRVFFFFTAVLLPIVWLFPETHGPTILANRAKKMRKEGVVGARAAHEDQHISWGQVISVHILRPAGKLILNDIETP